MEIHRSRLAVGAAAALILLTGTPAVAAPITFGTLHRVILDSGGATIVRPQFVNRRGEIVGYLPDTTGSGPSHPVMWRQYDSIIDLGLPGEFPSALNNRGDVLLGYDKIWSNGQVVTLQHPSMDVRVADLNDNRQVAGTLEGSPIYSNRAFRWQDGQFTNLGAPTEESRTLATAINNNGAVTGFVYGEPLNPPTGLFLWRNGVMTVFGTGLSEVNPREINDRDQVLFNAAASETASYHPQLWDRGRTVDLMAAYPNLQGVGADINNAGEAVGSLDSRPVLWRNGRTIHLLPPNWRGQAVAINERGDIAGAAVSKAGDGRVFLWSKGRVYLSPLETGTFAVPVPVGLDDRGRVAGVLRDRNEGSGDSRAFVWIP